MYSFESRIRYSETGSDGKLTILSLMDYFQDCSTFQSEDLGVGLSYLRERKLVWVLSSWQIAIERLPQMCERVLVGTFPYDFKGYFGFRNFLMKDEAGNYLAKANTMWTLLDTDTFKPTRLSEEIVRKYKLEEKLPMAYTGRKIMLQSDMEKQEGIVVKPHHLDTNHHVNNAQYVGMALDYLPEDYVVTGIRAEYKKQALLHDMLIPCLCTKCGERGAETRVVSLQDVQGTVYTNVEFEGRRNDDEAG
ncbi:MAG: acyl-[acyl-carrier-protein] thioesterase [Lachnospiraceae bacterium]